MAELSSWQRWLACKALYRKFANPFLRSSQSIMGERCTYALHFSNMIHAVTVGKIPRQSIKKQRHHFATEVHILKTMACPVVKYGCESWTVRKAKCQRIDAFKLWCWRRLFRVPSTARSNQSILKEINPEYSLKGLMLKLEPQYFGHLMRKADSLKRPWCWERLRAGREGDDRG